MHKTRNIILGASHKLYINYLIIHKILIIYKIHSKDEYTKILLQLYKFRKIKK